MVPVALATLAAVLGWTNVARAAPCGRPDVEEVVRSPRRPYAHGTLRLVWVGGETAPDRVVVEAADGTTEWAVVAVPTTGAAVATGTPTAPGIAHAHFFREGHEVACESVEVLPARQAGVRAVRHVAQGWTPALETFYAAFVERLFDYPIDDRTWPDLHTLLRDPEHNLLYDHFSAGEEGELELSPDCADLPFTLRAYFAWKLGLPFGVRACSRGREGVPPSCGDPSTNLAYSDEADGSVGAFERFARAVVANNVQSASTRTIPDDERTDLYPVPLTREALRPGTVYADPYGHVLVVVRHVVADDPANSYLLAADAQPDGTIGRPRFWQGTFLFTSRTDSVGAGFKAFRPLVRRGDVVRAVPNAELASLPRAPFSRSQYEGTDADFYARVEAAVDPRPVVAETRLASLVEALLASAVRRTVSVDNAETYVASHPGLIAMPHGAEIFLTSGAWEDYSTPSRDLRLLIALHVVLSFPEAVRARPTRYGLSSASDPALQSLDRRLEDLLAERSFEYAGTRGVRHRLTLADLRARREALEVAYNPNDCPEIRWGAPLGSAELERCGRRAPADQRRRMEEVRVWFRERRRPMR